MELNQESNDQKSGEEEVSQNKAKQWLQDNLRIIISVLIVVLIAGGIYSYSKRSQTPMNSQGSDTVAEGTIDNSTTNASEQTDRGNVPATASGATEEKKATPTTTASQETENSFLETAAKGDGMTILARKALADYLEKNPDSTLTVEHKIYIEDYLRKNVTQRKVTVGTSVEFSKNLIAGAITHSKTLTPKQLQNLHKYALRTPSLS